MTETLRGKVALVTGASAGIGAACARALAAEGGAGARIIEIRMRTMSESLA